MKNESNALLDKIEALKRGEEVDFEVMGFGTAFEKARTQRYRITRLRWIILTRFYPYVFVYHDTVHKHVNEIRVIHDWTPGSEDLLADDWVVL